LCNFDEYEIRLIHASECGEWTLASVRLGGSPAQQLVCRGKQRIEMIWTLALATRQRKRDVTMKQLLTEIIGGYEMLKSNNDGCRNILTGLLCGYVGGVNIKDALQTLADDADGSKADLLEEFWILVFSEVWERDADHSTDDAAVWHSSNGKWTFIDGPDLSYDEQLITREQWNERIDAEEEKNDD
jgi:hypothetical protein